MVWTQSHTRGENAFTLLVYIIMRASAAILALTILTSTTPFPTFLAALGWLRFPTVILSLMSFLYNFIYIIVDEFERLSIGRKSREFGSGIIMAWKSRAWMIGTFLVRTMERSERIYQAMLARGYKGEVITRNRMMEFRRVEIWISIFAAVAIILIRMGVTR